MDERDLQAQIDELRARLESAEATAGAHRDDTDANRSDIDALQKASIVDRSDIDRLQAGAEVDRHLIAELQADGVLRADHAEQLDEALKSARRIGAAIGIVMAAHRCDEKTAFDMLARTSMHANRRVRDIADEVILTGALP
jgi:AmiR/NasT family two-component response regulator